MTNYYRLLNISQTAAEDEIKQAIKTERRTWNQRENNPKQEIRAEAEERVRDIAEAEKILLNATSRENYDRELAKTPEKTTAIPTGDTVNWLEEAYAYFKKGDYDSMAYAAREATQLMPKEPNAWFWRGVSSSRQGRNDDAKFELQKAIELNPNDVDYYSELADVYTEMKDFGKAAEIYDKAYKMDSSNLYYLTSVAECLRMNGKVEEALATAKTAYGKDNSYQFAQLVYVLCILKQILNSISYDSETDNHAITNKAQLDFAKERFAFMQTLRTDSEDAKEVVSLVNELIMDAEKKEYRGSQKIIWYLGVVAFGLIYIFGVGSGTEMFGVLLVAAAVSIFVYRHYKARWQWYKKTLRTDILKTGLQA